MNVDELERYMDGTAALLQLPIDPAHRPGVLRYLALAAGFAQQLEAAELSPHDESAVGFRPLDAP